MPSKPISRITSMVSWLSAGRQALKDVEGGRPVLLRSESATAGALALVAFIKESSVGNSFSLSIAMSFPQPSARGCELTVFRFEIVQQAQDVNVPHTATTAGLTLRSALSRRMFREGFVMLDMACFHGDGFHSLGETRPRRALGLRYEGSAGGL